MDDKKAEQELLAAHASEQRARQAAEETAARLTRLQRVTAALARAVDVEGIGEAVVAEGLPVLGASAAGVQVLDEVDEVLATVRRRGYESDYAARFARTPLAASTPGTEAVRTRRPIVWEDAAELAARYPELTPLPSSTSHEAGVSFPLMAGDGMRALGALTIRFAEKRRLAESDQAMLETIATMVAQALERALQYDQVRTERQRTGRLQAITAALSEADTPEAVVSVALEQSRAELNADGAFVALVDASGRNLEIIQSTGFPEKLLERFRVMPLDLSMPITEACRTVTPVFVESHEELAQRFPPAVELSKETGRSVSASIPLAARGKVLGVLGLSFTRTRPFDPHPREFLLAVARQCALALERARLLATERQLRAEAQAANRAKDEFLAMLGHELRNPLSPIVTALHLMRLRDPNALVKERGVIERQVRHVVRLVDDLLDISRITRGRVTLEKKPLELGEIVAKAVEMASPLFEERRHRLTLAVPAAGLGVTGDEHRLAQVVSNLLTNAAKYTEPGGHIDVSAVAEDDQLVLRVKDNGIGIDAKLLPRVFDLFVQGEQPLERAQGGLGLGLAIVWNLVQLHGGRVEAFSEGHGRGSVFTVRLPRLNDRASSSVAESRTAPLRANAAAPRATRVLLVDDNQDAAEAVAEVLMMSGYEVTVAPNGPAGLELASREAPDLALLDLGLPVMDGYELAQRLHELPGLADLPLIAVTGYGHDVDRARSTAAGFREHLVKPVDLDHLCEVIGRFGGNQRFAPE